MTEGRPRQSLSREEHATPEDKEGIGRLLGFVQYLSKFIPNLSQVDVSLRELMKSDVEFAWD